MNKTITIIIIFLGISLSNCCTEGDIEPFIGPASYIKNVQVSDVLTQFDNIINIAIDTKNNIYIVTKDKLQKVSPNGNVSIIANYTFSQSYGIGLVIDTQNNVYITDDNCIKKITPNGVVSTFAGGSTSGSVNGTGTEALFFVPKALTIDTEDNIYVADSRNHRVRKITPNGTVTTLAGSTYGVIDGIGSEAQFSNLEGITVDTQGNVYVSDDQNNRIRKITPKGVVSILAGSTYGFADGTGTSAHFYGPANLTIDAFSNVYVVDKFNDRVRKITSKGVVKTFEIEFSSLSGLSIDNQGNIFVIDNYYNRIQKITQL